MIEELQSILDAAADTDVPAAEPGELVLRGITVQTSDHYPVQVTIDPEWVEEVTITQLAQTLQRVLEDSVAAAAANPRQPRPSRLGQLLHEYDTEVR